MMRSSRMRMWLFWILTLTLVCAGNSAWCQDSAASPAATSNQPQVAQPTDGGVNWKGVGAGAGAVASNLVYVPAKLVYGILGGIAGGAGYALTGGNKQVANSIWRSSLGGDYVLTPDMMTGKQPIYFSGPSEAGPTQATTAGSSALPANAASSMPSVSSSAPVTSSSTSPATHPIDNGAGLVGTTTSPSPAPYAGTSNPQSSYGAYSRPTAPKTSHLSDTSIE
jgi:hypothetical protein